MAQEHSIIVSAAFADQARQLAEIQSRQPRTIATKTATGSGDINQLCRLDRAFRLVFVRCHFVGGSGTDAFVLSLASAGGSAYDTRLFTISQAGVSRDVHFRLDVSDEPAAWTFQAQDDLRIEWTNPDPGNVTWGLEVGLAIASVA